MELVELIGEFPLGVEVTSFTNKEYEMLSEKLNEEIDKFLHQREIPISYLETIYNR
ncbi:MAG: hypothetical protein AABW81_01425 [Nanoarchaeota archaeon]